MYVLYMYMSYTVHVDVYSGCNFVTVIGEGGVMVWLSVKGCLLHVFLLTCLSCRYIQRAITIQGWLHSTEDFHSLLAGHAFIQCGFLLAL